MTEKLFAFISTIFSVAVFEKREDHIKLNDFDDDSFFYLSKPYEPFCKENLSFLLKLITNINYESGLRPLINDAHLHSSLYKHLHFMLLSNSKDPV